MSTVVFHTAEGRIVQCITGDDALLALQPTPQGCGRLVCDGAPLAYTHYVDGGKVLAIPPAPEAMMRFEPAQKAWVRDAPLAWWTIRQARNAKLLASDWTDTVSARTRLGEDAFQAWQHYRQALRDLTLAPDPYTLHWPQAPG